jgi:hypothetical protein
MSEQDYETLVAAYPTHIPFPKINRPHRSGKMTLSEVHTVDDLPSRLIFGDLVPNSFTGKEDNWSVEYRDANGNALDLSVHDGRFEAKPNFLGSEGRSVGPAWHREAFGQLINLGADQWDGVLKDYLEASYPIQVAPVNREQTHSLFIPDGWMKTILVPVAPEQLEKLLAWYMALADDNFLAAGHSGAVDLLFNAVNYLEGKCPAGWDDPAQLTVRGLVTCNTPIHSQVAREVANDGSAAWTTRRSAYLFSCTVFLRDVPRIVELLSTAGFISSEPDLCSAVVPVESALASNEMQWWSPDKACRMTWVWEEDQTEHIVADLDADLDAAVHLVRQAKEAGIAHRKYLGLFDEYGNT